MFKHKFISGLLFSAAFILASGGASAQKRSYHSGNYKGGSGSSHKGGSYKNSSTNDHYVRRKKH